MDQSRHRTQDDQFEQLSRTALRWVLGPGLLTLHVGIYLITVVALILWNFARTPSDVWVDGPLRQWGLVVVFHITAVAAGWSAWRLMRLGETPPTLSRRIGPAYSSSRGTNVTGTHGAQTTAFQPVAKTVQATDSLEPLSQRWQSEPDRSQGDLLHAPLTNGSHAPKNGNEATASSVTEWGSLFVRRTREMMTSARDYVSPEQRARHAKLNGTLNSVDAIVPPDPLRTWPEAASAETTTTPADPLSSPVKDTWPSSTNGTVHSTGGTEPTSLNEFQIDLNEISYPLANDILNVEHDPASQTPHESAATEDARWTWVESAASAWMARRERDEPDEPRSTLAETPQTSGDEPTSTPS